MLKYLKQMTNYTRTENGALTYKSTENDCLDLFSAIGALRTADEQDIVHRFARAYAENADAAMKILFYARDIRGGLGERRVFRTILRWLACNEPESAVKNMKYICEYGRYDDMIVLLDTPCRDEAVNLITAQLAEDMRNMEKGKEISLLAKWLPSVNASSANTVRNAKAIAKALNMTDAQYRKILSALRAYIKIIENNLRTQDYSFDYAKQPSKAMYKYRKAFIRNDKERYCEYMNQVSRGEAKINTQALMPYEIIRPLCREYMSTNAISKTERMAINTMWEALEDFTNDENAIAVVDGSGSMYYCGNPLPASVALSLGIYFAEHSKGAFANHFITFSSNPRLVEIKGRNIAEKVHYCESFNEVANTNIQKVFDLILHTAVKNKLPQEELPSTIYIISDMEFDMCAEGADITNFEYAKKRYAKYGYNLPKVIFWNVQSRNIQQPVKMNEQGVALVSGCTPRIFSMVTEGKLNPYDFMMDIINNERYAVIAA